MIKSMTGFASLTRDLDDGTISVTVRAVNHRYLDLQIRLPQAWSHLESRLRGRLQSRLARGRVEVLVGIHLRQASTMAVDVNDDVVRALAGALERVRGEGLLAGQLGPGDLLRVPQAITVRETPLDPESTEAERIGREVETAVDAAAAELDVMRLREGDHLAADLDARRRTLGVLLAEIAVAADEGRADLQARLHERVREIGATALADPAAIAQEIVRYAARSDISEEMVRFQSHLAQWEGLAAASEPCGRKLDFVLQEMNREVNTIGAKADGSRVSALIVELKAELEKMREQVQNVE